MQFYSAQPTPLCSSTVHRPTPPCSSTVRTPHHYAVLRCTDAHHCAVLKCTPTEPKCPCRYCNNKIPHTLHCRSKLLWLGLTCFKRRRLYIVGGYQRNSFLAFRRWYLATHSYKDYPICPVHTRTCYWQVNISVTRLQRGGGWCCGVAAVNYKIHH